jgi:hypothetical protein
MNEKGQLANDSDGTMKGMTYKVRQKRKGVNGHQESWAVSSLYGSPGGSLKTRK